jgi:hypothetical protein
VEFLCGADPAAVIDIANLCKTPSYALQVTFNANPTNVMDNTGKLKCSALVAIPNQPVQIAWVVNNQGACTPKSGLFSFTVPAPKPSPVPSPAPSGSCVTCSMQQVIDEIKVQCAANPTDGIFYFTEERLTPGSHCWWTDPGIGAPTFKTTPDILLDDGNDAGDCMKITNQNLKGKPVTLTITVNPEIDTTITCSPTSTTVTFTIPNY